MKTIFRKIITERIKVVLKPAGFTKKGNYFVFKQNDITYYISTQSSQSTTENMLIVTVNIGLASAGISRVHDISLPEDQQRHWEKRIGAYFPDHNDKWWSISSESEAVNAGNEIAAVLKLNVLPEILGIQSTKDLAALWKQGEYPGFSDKLANELLQLLEENK